MQIQQYVGTQWLFGAGKDVEVTNKEGLRKVIKAQANQTAAAKAASVAGAVSTVLIQHAEAQKKRNSTAGQSTAARKNSTTGQRVQARKNGTAGQLR